MIRLRKSLLKAIVDMSNRVEAAGVKEHFGYDHPNYQALYQDCIDAGTWAAEELARRAKRRSDG